MNTYLLIIFVTIAILFTSCGNAGAEANTPPLHRTAGGRNGAIACGNAGAEANAPSLRITAVGGNATLITAAHATGPWTPTTVETKRQQSSLNTLRGVDTDGSTWVAVGPERVICTRNKSNPNWHPARLSGINDLLESVIHHGTTWVAVGWNSAIFTSTDSGQTWRGYRGYPSPAPNAPIPHVLLRDVATDGTTWVTVGTSTILTTRDPISGVWTLLPDLPKMFLSITYDDTTWVVVGVAGVILTATTPREGESWSWNAAANSEARDKTLYSVATDGSIWVAVGDEGSILTATDPRQVWTDRTLNSGTTERLTSVATDGSTWIAVGRKSTLITTTDPTQLWTLQTVEGMPADKNFHPPLDAVTIVPADN